MPYPPSWSAGSSIAGWPFHAHRAQPKDTKTAQAKLKPAEKNMSSGTYTVQAATTAKERARQQEEFERKRAAEAASNAAFLKEFMERNPSQRSQVPAYLRALCTDPSDAPAPAAPVFDSATIRRIGYNPSTGILAKPSDDRACCCDARRLAPLALSRASALTRA